MVKNLNDKVVGEVRKDEQLRLHEEGDHKEADSYSLLRRKPSKRKMKKLKRVRLSPKVAFSLARKRL